MHVELVAFLRGELEKIHVAFRADHAVERERQRPVGWCRLRGFVVRLGFEDVREWRHAQPVWRRRDAAVLLRENGVARVGLRGQFQGRGDRPAGVAEVGDAEWLAGLPARREDHQRARERADVQEVATGERRGVRAVAEREQILAVLGRDEAEHRILNKQRAVIALGKHRAVLLFQRQYRIQKLPRAQPNAHDFRGDALPLFRLDDEAIRLLAREAARDRRTQRDGLHLVFFRRGTGASVVVFHHRIRRDVKRARIAQAGRRPHAHRVLAERRVRRDFDLRLELPRGRFRDARHFQTATVKNQPARIFQPRPLAHHLHLRPALPARRHDARKRGRSRLCRRCQRERRARRAATPEAR